MAEKYNSQEMLQQLETQLTETVKVRDWLNERIRLIRESLERLRKQAQVNEQLALDPPSKALLILLNDLVSGEATSEPAVLSGSREGAAVISEVDYSRNPKSYGLISLLQKVLETLTREKTPESVSEALAVAFGDTWAQKSFCLLRGGGNRVTVNTYLRGEVPEEFRRYLADAFLKLRAVHLNLVPEGFAPSDLLVALAEKTARKWSNLEQVVVEKWLPAELAHLSQRK